MWDPKTLPRSDESDADQQQDFMERVRGMAQQLQPQQRKFAAFRSLCRSMPHDIILEILEYIQMHVNDKNLRDFVGRFSNASDRRFVLLFRSVKDATVDGIGTSKSHFDRKQGLEQALYKLVLRDCRQIGLFLQGNEKTRRFFDMCRRNGLLGKVRKIFIHSQCIFETIDNLIPSQFLQKIRTVHLASGGRSVSAQSSRDAVAALTKLPQLRHLALFFYQHSFDASMTVLGPVLEQVHSFEVIADVKAETLRFLCSNLGEKLVSLKLSNPTALTACYNTVKSSVLQHYQICLYSERDSFECSQLPRFITYLQLHEQKISSLDGIECLEHLTKLDVSGLEIQKIESIGLISQCKNLESLSLSFDGNSDYDPYARVFLDLDGRGQLKSFKLDLSEMDKAALPAVLQVFGLVRSSGDASEQGKARLHSSASN